MTTKFIVSFEFTTDAPQENEAVARRRIREGLDRLADRFAGRVGGVVIDVEHVEPRYTAGSFVQALIDGGGTNIV